MEQFQGLFALPQVFLDFKFNYLGRLLIFLLLFHLLKHSISIETQEITSKIKTETKDTDSQNLNST